MEKRKKGKAGKIILTILLSLILLILLMTLINHLCCLSEKSKITDYGTKVEVTGGTMNVGIFGNGEDVIVLLPGCGDVSPVLSFKQLAGLLSEKCTVVVPEPFGYGLSDITDRERSATNKANELHECLASLGYTSYTLMGHSLSGITMLEYSNLYPDEVIAVIALDTSVPKQNSTANANRNIFSTKMSMFLIKAAQVTGILRLYYTFGGTQGIEAEYLSAEEIDTLKYIIYSPSLYNRNVFEEYDYFNNVDSIRLFNTKYPDDIPVLTFLSKDNVEYEPEWEQWHIELSDNPQSRAEILSGSHAVFINNPEEIAEKSIEFITD